MAKIKVTVGNATFRRSVIVDSETPVKDILKNEDIDYSTARVTCNGETLKADQFSKSIGSIVGDTDECYLMAVVKIDNGSI